MKTRGNYKKFNKQIEEQINNLQQKFMSRKSYMDRKTTPGQIQTSTKDKPTTDIINKVLPSSTKYNDEDEDLHGGWIRPLEWTDRDDTHIDQTQTPTVRDEMEASYEKDRTKNETDDTVIYTICTICDQISRPETAIDCIVCKGTMHQECEMLTYEDMSKIDAEDYVCNSCTSVDIGDTMPKQLYPTADEIDMERTTPKQISSPHTTDIIESKGNHTGKLQPTCSSNGRGLDRKTVTSDYEGEFTKLVPHINQGQMSTKIHQIKDDTEKSQKTKQKKQCKTKDNSTTQQQLEEQLTHCKARLVMMEDTNRDYKNTINLLRTQAEDYSANVQNRSYQNNCKCRCEVQNQSQEVKLDMMLQNFRLEMENRDLKLQHQMELNELKHKIQMLEMQRELSLYQSMHPQNAMYTGQNSVQNHNAHGQYILPQRVPNPILSSIQPTVVYGPQQRIGYQPQMAPPPYNHLLHQHHNQGTRPPNMPFTTNSATNIVPTYAHANIRRPNGEQNWQANQEHRKLTPQQMYNKSERSTMSHMNRRQYVQNLYQTERSGSTNNINTKPNNKVEHCDGTISKTYRVRASLHPDAQGSTAELTTNKNSHQVSSGDASLDSDENQEVQPEETSIPSRLENAGAESTNRTFSGDASLKSGCRPKFSSQRTAEDGGPIRLNDSDQAQNTEKSAKLNHEKPNHFLEVGRSNRIKGRNSV